MSNLLLNETDLNKEIKDIQSKSKSDSHPTLDSINLIRNDIADTVGALNFQKEQNHAEEESIEDLKLLLSSLKELVNYAETEFTTKWLDEFDKWFFVDSKPRTNAVELYKSITNLLKRVEKEYEFNAIDPIDEERDYTDLKKKLIAYEKHKLNVIKSESQDDLLSHEDKSKLFKIDEIKDLNELKRLEDLIIGVLTKKNIKIGYNLDAIENSTLELSNGYFKKAIFKERDKMINKKSELVTKQIELNWKRGEYVP